MSRQTQTPSSSASSSLSQQSAPPFFHRPSGSARERSHTNFDHQQTPTDERRDPMESCGSSLRSGEGRASSGETSKAAGADGPVAQTPTVASHVDRSHRTRGPSSAQEEFEWGLDEREWDFQHGEPDEEPVDPDRAPSKGGLVDYERSNSSESLLERYSNQGISAVEPRPPTSSNPLGSPFPDRAPAPPAQQRSQLAPTSASNSASSSTSFVTPDPIPDVSPSQLAANDMLGYDATRFRREVVKNRPPPTPVGTEDDDEEGLAEGDGVDRAMPRGTEQATGMDALRSVFEEDSLEGEDLQSQPSFGKGAYRGTLFGLPDLDDLSDGELTSHPTTLVQRDLDLALRKLVSIEALREVLRTPVGRLRFKDHIDKRGKPESATLLTFYADAVSYQKFLEETNSVGLALQEIFLSSTAHRRADIPTATGLESKESLTRQQDLLKQSPFHRVSELALERLFEREFSSFIQSKIIGRASGRLGDLAYLVSDEDCDGIFAISDFRQHDQPIVACSDGFIQLTGFPRPNLIGRNCRFLQGPGTSREAVARVRAALMDGRPCSEILLNYRADGEGFWNCLSMIPLRAITGEVDFFIGSQIDISAALANPESIALLCGIDDAARGNPAVDLKLSPDVVSAVERQIGRKSVFSSHRTVTFDQSLASKTANLLRENRARSQHAHKILSASGLGLSQDGSASGSVGDAGPLSPSQGGLLSPPLGGPSSSGMGEAIGGGGLAAARSPLTSPRVSMTSSTLPPRAKPVRTFAPKMPSLPYQESVRAATALAESAEYYTKMLIIHPRTLEILYVTPGFLQGLGYSTAHLTAPGNPSAVAAAIQHRHLKDLLAHPSKKEAEAALASITSALTAETSATLSASFKRFFFSADHPSTVATSMVTGAGRPPVSMSTGSSSAGSAGVDERTGARYAVSQLRFKLTPLRDGKRKCLFFSMHVED